MLVYAQVWLWSDVLMKDATVITIFSTLWLREGTECCTAEPKGTYWWQAMGRSCSCCGVSSGRWQLHWGRCFYCYCAHTLASPRQGPETVKLPSLLKPQRVQLKHSLQSRVGVIRACSVCKNWVLFIPSEWQCPVMGKIWHIHLWKCWGSAGGCW